MQHCNLGNRSEKISKKGSKGTSTIINSHQEEKRKRDKK